MLDLISDYQVSILLCISMCMLWKCTGYVHLGDPCRVQKRVVVTQEQVMAAKNDGTTPKTGCKFAHRTIHGG